MRHWLAMRSWEGAGGRPGSQETCSDRKAERPSWKGVALMLSTRTLATAATLCAIPALLTATGASGAATTPSSARLAAAGPTVTVRIEGAKRTLLAATVVHTTRGWLTRGGAPKGACSAASAAGALQIATAGRWSGAWESKYGDYFLTRILGDTEGGKTSYWDLLVNNVAASTGACGVKLRNGDHLVFAAVPSSGAGDAESRSAHSAGADRRPCGQAVQVFVIAYNAKGNPVVGRGDRARGEAGRGRPRSRAAPIRARTNAGHCDARRDHEPGGIVLGASKTGDARATADDVSVTA